MIQRYLTAATLVLAAAVSGASAQVVPPPAPAPDPPATTLVVFMQGMPLGSEQVVVTRGPDGCTIKSSGRLGAPANITTARFEVVYDRDWKPLRMDLEGSLRGQPLVLHTVFANGSASNDITQSGTKTQKTDAVAADTLVIPNLILASYEALAMRLVDAKVGTSFRGYVVPQAEIDIQVTGSSEVQIQTSAGIVTARLFQMTFVSPNAPAAAELWIDSTGRLVRFRVAAQGLEIAREDVASVSSRVVRMTRAGDEQVRMQANGFSLAGTLSRPAGAAPAPDAKHVPRLPALVLIPGSGPVDRDETVSGIPVFAQLANTLSDAGYLVVRYDKRGVGQSGGRDESATIDDYAEDARAVVNYLRKRKDVDENRIALVGHSEGGLVGLIASSREKKRVRALVLIATPGTTGAELVLEQQRHLLERMDLPEGERRDRIELQEKIQKAVISGTGWEAIPPGFRRQAETPWFRSFLLFDPAPTLAKTELPIFIVQGERDRQVPVRHAHRLMELARARKSGRVAHMVIIDGINHLLVPAPTGEITEYPTLPVKTVSAEVGRHVSTWLKEVMPSLPPGK